MGWGGRGQGGGQKETELTPKVWFAIVLVLIWESLVFNASEHQLFNAIPYLMGSLRLQDFPFPWW